MTLPMIRRTLLTVHTVSALKTEGQFAKAYAVNGRDRTRINDAYLAAGRGFWKNAERDAAAKAGDALALLDLALVAEAHALGYHARTWFGQEPYLVHPKPRSLRRCA